MHFKYKLTNQNIFCLHGKREISLSFLNHVRLLPVSFHRNTLGKLVFSTGNTFSLYSLLAGKVGQKRKCLRNPEGEREGDLTYNNHIIKGNADAN